MDSTHLHLLLNHIPILGTFFGLCLLAYGLIDKNGTLEKAGLTTIVMVALFTIPAFLSGEESEDKVESIPGVSEFYLEQHEELAEVALWLMIATGAIALLSLIISKVKANQRTWLNIITVLMVTATFGVMVVVGSYGGKIRHSEIRGNGADQTDQNTMHEEIEDEYNNDD